MTRKQFLSALFGAPLATLGLKKKPVGETIHVRTPPRLAMPAELPRFEGWSSGPANIQPGDRLTFDL